MSRYEVRRAAAHADPNLSLHGSGTTGNVSAIVLLNVVALVVLVWQAVALGWLFPR